MDGRRELLPVFHPARRVYELRNLVQVGRQKTCGGRMVTRGPRIYAHAPRERLGFGRIGVECSVKVDDAKRRRPQYNASRNGWCFLPRPDKWVFAALPLIRACETEVAERTLPEIHD
jgi:hypothetical protein